MRVPRRIPMVVSGRVGIRGALFPPLSSVGCGRRLQSSSALSSDKTSTISSESNTPQNTAGTTPGDTPQNTTTTHFGFQTVPESTKESLVGRVFSNVADKYDIMNDVMSIGVHRLWKDHLIRSLAPHNGCRLLDVAGGTGDIAFRFMDYNRACYGESHKSQVDVVDINPQMLDVGKQRALDLSFSQSTMSWTVGNAESLESIADASMDAYTIAFGIRNCTHIDRVLREAFRVLKPGGRFLCLEFGHVSNPLIKTIYDRYSFDVIPVFGGLVANDRDSYQYLVESIRKFPPQPQFAKMIQDAGFKLVRYEDLTFGVAAIWQGLKI